MAGHDETRKKKKKTYFSSNLFPCNFLLDNIPRLHLLLLTPHRMQKKQNKTKQKTGGKLTHTPSFEDFSLGTAADAEEELSPKAASLSAAAAAAAAGKKKNDTGPRPPPPQQPLARASAPGDLSHSPPSTPSPSSAGSKHQLSSSSASSLGQSAAGQPAAANEVTKQPSGATLWGSVFHPGRWGHRHETGEPPLALGTKYYDTAGEGDKTTWEEVVKSERLQTLARLPRTDVGGTGGEGESGGGGGGGGGGFVDAGQLRAALGPSEDVEQLIAAARDGRREGDERVPFDVFANLLRNS